MEIIKLTGIVIAALVALTTLYKFFWKAPSEEKVKTATSNTETIATRFIALFESHGVHRNQIPDFFDHTITLHDCADETELLKKLNSQCLRGASELFGVNLAFMGS